MSRPPLAWTPPGRVDDDAPRPGRLHVVLGAGQMESLVAVELRSRGHQVRVVHRRAGPPPAPGMEVAHAAVRGAEDVAHLTDGAAPAVRGRRRVAVARASDLFGPGVASSVVFGERFFRRVLSGRPAGVYGDPELPHSYAYVLDVVAGLVALGASGVASGVYMLPVQPAESTRAVIQRFYEALGVDPGVARLSTWALRLREFFSPGVEDLGDRVYQWKQPFVVDDRRIRSELGIAPSPWGEAVRDTVAWARSAFGSRRHWPPSGKSMQPAGPWRMVRPREDPP